MRQVILDTSFILTAVRQKIDFFHNNGLLGFEILVPQQALKELKGLGAKLALKVLEKNKDAFKVVKIQGKDADAAIIALAQQNPQAVVATLDAGLKKKIKNPKLIIRNKKKLEII